MDLALLRLKRKARKLSQQDLADHFNYTRQNYGAKEIGKQNFKLSEIKELKDLLELTDSEVCRIFL